jgi:hypothetical protein
MRSRLQRGRLPSGSGLLLIPAAALLVHQLRYTLAYGSQAGSQLAATGHSYQHSLVPWVILTLGVGLSSFLRRAAHAMRSGDTMSFEHLSPLARLSAGSLWAVTTVGLLAVYALQESLEEMYASGHPTGFTGVFGHGGWWAVPSAVVVAIGVVALLRVGRAVLRFAGRLAARPIRFRLLTPVAPAAVVLVVPAPLARAAAGRAPPHLFRAG